MFHHINLNVLAKTFFGINIYLLLVIMSNFEEVGTPWNFVASITILICNSLLCVVLFGDEEKED